MPTHFQPQSSSQPDAIGSNYASDVIRRCGQFILIMREDVTSYTDAVWISSESASSLKDGVILLSCKFRSSAGPVITVRIDSATGFQSLTTDSYLKSLGINLELGHPKNKNRNPTAEKSISELEAELSRVQPTGGVITATTLALAVSNLNNRIRSSGHSSLEMWTQRDMHTRKQIQLNDDSLMKNKYNERLRNHMSSSKYKARGKMNYDVPSVERGDIVYIYSDRDKTRARDGYLVMSVDNDKCTLQKLTGSQFRRKKFIVSLYDVYKPETTDGDLPYESTDLQPSHADSQSTSTPQRGADDSTQIKTPAKKALNPLISDPPQPGAPTQPANTPVPGRSTMNRRDIKPPRHHRDFVMGSWQ